MATPTLTQIHDTLQVDWNENLDTERSLFVARAAPVALARTSDVASALTGTSLAAEVLWDAPTSREALDLVGEYRVAALHYARSLPPADALAIVVEALVLSARACHRAEPGLRAISFVIEAQRRLLHVAGSREQLCRLAAQGHKTGVLYGSTLAIGIPGSRVAATGAPNIARLRDTFIRDAKLILTQAPDPASHPRLFSLVSQTFFAVVEQSTDDAEFVADLKRLEAQIRPKHARAQATRPLIDMRYASYQGNTEAEASYAIQAAQNIEAAGLRRHQDVLSKRNWLPGR